MNDDLILVLFLAALVVLWAWLKFTKSREKCPNCGKSRRRKSGTRTSLAKEVRYKDVTREVKDSNGKVIKTYRERVPVNYSHNRYELDCEQCGHSWTATKWEPY